MRAQAFYANPETIRYPSAPSAAFGAATQTQTFIGPKGKKGLVRDIEVFLTADAVGTTTVPEIDVGTASGDVSYARLRLGSAAGTGYGTGVQRASQLIATLGTAQVPPPAASDYAGHVALETAFIPKDTALVITLKAGTGGTPAGTASVYVVIKWF